MPNLNYIRGNVIDPILPEVVICHVCNDIGRMGSGVAKAISDKWPIVKKEYLDWFSRPKYMNKKEPVLGEVDYIRVNDYIIVCNMIAQHSIISLGESKPIRYDALEKCLTDVYDFCKDMKLTLHMPKIGSGLARGDWTEIEKIILKTITIDTWVYEWNKK